MVVHYCFCQFWYQKFTILGMASTASEATEVAARGGCLSFLGAEIDETIHILRQLGC